MAELIGVRLHPYTGGHVLSFGTPGACHYIPMRDGSAQRAGEPVSYGSIFYPHDEEDWSVAHDIAHVVCASDHERTLLNFSMTSNEEETICVQFALMERCGYNAEDIAFGGKECGVEAPKIAEWTARGRKTLEDHIAIRLRKP